MVRPEVMKMLALWTEIISKHVYVYATASPTAMQVDWLPPPLNLPLPWLQIYCNTRVQYNWGERKRVSQIGIFHILYYFLAYVVLYILNAEI